MDLNAVAVVGRLTRDPELQYLDDGKPLCKFSIAINGYKKDEVFFIDVIVWGKQSENVNQYCKKGSQVGIDGSLRQDRWEKDGQKRSRIFINANSVQFLGGKSTGQTTQQNSIESQDVPF